ncbi:MAG: epoxyqueuosine reductase QueH [Mailhella sp.]|nr:epoxyqueuosine reductase QueH [Mailhella sp.]
MPRILIHACCGPCSLMPIVHLRKEGWDPTLFYFNPNIHPAWEWEKRLDALRQVSEVLCVPLIEEGDQPDPSAWLSDLGGVVQEGARCRLCYRPRLQRASELAAALQFDAFTTSLLYSRYQHHGTICEEARNAAARHGAFFLYRDFRFWWYDGIRMSKELGIYRQKWCGCVLSMGEAVRQQKEAAERKARQKAERAAKLAQEAEARRLKKEAQEARQSAKRNRKAEKKRLRQQSENT